jgi:hypothetical protein
MQIPDRFPSLKGITILWGISMVVWAAWEGGLWLTVSTAVFSLILFLAFLLKRVLLGRTFSTTTWLLLMAFLGTLVGLASGPITLVFMAIKTGLHAHGPEFSTAEIGWILQQIPMWSLVGFLTGLSLGLLLIARSSALD